ncbi:hypothetical protein ACFLYD_05870 [Chloroflexota bacterium]
MTNLTRTNSPAVPSGDQSVRLHCLDWLQVLAILGVFFFHAVRPFDDLPAWHIENAEASALVTFFAGFSFSGGCRFSS